MLPCPVNHLTLIGVGLIGGSFVLDLKRQGLVKYVHGIDIDSDNLERALERQVIDSAATQIDAQLANTDIVMIATPIRQFQNILRQLRAFLHQDTIVTEVGSTKADVIKLFKETLPEFFPNYVATHPIAGSDRNGALAAQFGLFKDKKIILCPHPQQNPQALQSIRHLWQATGGQIEELPATEHDNILASVSHLPHLLAFAFIHQTMQQKDPNTCFHFAGSGFKDFTRIASSDPSVWTDISLENDTLLIKLIQETRQELDKLALLLEHKDQNALHQYFSQAKQRRDDWLKEKNTSAH